jgi:hypothetical protein
MENQNDEPVGIDWGSWFVAYLFTTFLVCGLYFMYTGDLQRFVFDQMRARKPPPQAEAPPAGAADLVLDAGAVFDDFVGGFLAVGGPLVMVTVACFASVTIFRLMRKFVDDEQEDD